MKRLTARDWLVLGAAAAFASGCSSPQLPPGLPAPEYEKPALPPWPPSGSDAGVPEPTAPPAPEGGGPDAGVPLDGAAGTAGGASDNLLDPARQAPVSGPE